MCKLHLINRHAAVCRLCCTVSSFKNNPEGTHFEYLRIRHNTTNNCTDPSGLTFSEEYVDENQIKDGRGGRR